MWNPCHGWEKFSSVRRNCKNRGNFVLKSTYLSCGNFAAVRPKSHNNFLSSCSRTAPWPRPLVHHPERSIAVDDSLAPFPHYRHYSLTIQMPLKSALYRHRASRSEDRRAWQWNRMAAARAGYVYPCCNVSVTFPTIAIGRSN